MFVQKRNENSSAEAIFEGSRPFITVQKKNEFQKELTRGGYSMIDA